MGVRSSAVDWETIFGNILQGIKQDLLVFPSGITSLRGAAFYGAELGDVVIPNTVTSIGASCFYQAHIDSISIPTTVTQIGGGAFAGSNLEHIDWPGSVTTINGAMFANSGLKSISINEGVTTVINAFSGCPGLKTITLPSTVTFMGYGGFTGNRLDEMIFLSITPPTLQYGAQGNTTLGPFTDTFPIYVPDNSVADYKAAADWVNYKDRVTPLSERVTGGG